MSPSANQIPEAQSVWTGPPKNLVETNVEANKEVNTPVSIAFDADTFKELFSCFGMGKTPVTVSDFVVQRFSQLENVRALLAGESNDVTHVWIMIDTWTPEVRRAVYQVQKSIMKVLSGFHNFDFYVVDLPNDARPEELVSDMPVIFNRAQQERTSFDCQQ